MVVSLLRKKPSERPSSATFVAKFLRGSINEPLEPPSTQTSTVRAGYQGLTPALEGQLDGSEGATQPQPNLGHAETMASPGVVDTTQKSEGTSAANRTMLLETSEETAPMNLAVVPPDEAPTQLRPVATLSTADEGEEPAFTVRLSDSDPSGPDLVETRTSVPLGQELGETPPPVLSSSGQLGARKSQRMVAASGCPEGSLRYSRFSFWCLCCCPVRRRLKNWRPANRLTSQLLHRWGRLRRSRRTKLLVLQLRRRFPLPHHVPGVKTRKVTSAEAARSVSSDASQRTRQEVCSASSVLFQNWAPCLVLGSRLIFWPLGWTRSPACRKLRRLSDLCPGETPKFTSRTLRHDQASVPEVTSSGPLAARRVSNRRKRSAIMTEAEQTTQEVPEGTGRLELGTVDSTSTATEVPRTAILAAERAQQDVSASAYRS